jgi:two-component sensor histidine kinase
MTEIAGDITEKVNILLVDDQPGKLMSYEVILQELDQNLLKANSAKEALELLLKNDVAVILVDVCMPELDGFELARLIRDHPRFKDTAIIFISAINVTELDSLKGYELGAVDYVPVPVVPGVLRAKVRVFVDLHVKTRALARMNDELEQRVAERTAQLEAAIARQELLAREVDHRARNALAVIQSIVSLTPADDSRQFGEAIKGRIRAMAMAHNLLSESRWEGADLLRLVTEELAPYAQGERVKVTGEAVSIAPAVAQNLALALHELATNAAKYGALSNPEGRVAVSWLLLDDGLSLDWLEDGGVDVTAPSRAGFGSKVIEASIRGQLRGAIERTWLSSGLSCAITLPREHFSRPVRRAKAAADAGRADIDMGRMRGLRVLVLEDEPLIAMMTSRIVRDMDAVVLGPFASIQEAREEISGHFDVALLDVNVGGEMVYDLADQIRERGTPIIFVTGYHSGVIEPRFADAPVLTKPVERDDLSIALAGVMDQSRPGSPRVVYADR